MHHKASRGSVLESLSIQALNPMQEEAEKSILDHRSVILLSPTGSGKTLAFLLPVFRLLDAGKKQVQALVITPSRELALQIEAVWKKMNTGFKVNACYGGHSMQVETKNLSVPPALLIGTPGRIADHLRRKTVDLRSVQFLVLDEFDKSLAMGFEADMSYILERLPGLQKRVLVSATREVEIPEFVGMVPAHVLDFISPGQSIPTLKLKMVRSFQKDKLDALLRLLSLIGNENCMVFCNHRDAVERIGRHLEEHGVPAGIYHGKLEQDERELALIKFRNGSTRTLVTTDLGSRGLDIPEMKHVIHYQLPPKEEVYIHRNGRTARMHAEGTSYLVLQEEEQIPSYIQQIPDLIDLPEEIVLPGAPGWITLYIGAGRKNKINKVDIVGFLIQKGKLAKEDLGIIEVKDFSAFAAVKKDKMKALLPLIRKEKIKGKKYKVAVAR
jgi:superfamily II DNA/RNA helicase